MKELGKIKLNTNKNISLEQTEKYEDIIKAKEQEALKKLAGIEIEKKKRDIINNCFTEPNYRNNTFDKIKTENDIYRLCIGYVKNFELYKKENIGLAFWGNTGSGKTYWSCCIANELLNKGYTVIFRTITEVINDIRGAMVNGHQNKIIKELVDCDLLIIDDYGVEAKTEFVNSQIFELLDKRNNKKFPLIITTNIISLFENNPNDDIHLKRIKSRLNEMCTPIKCNGIDHRKEIQKNKINKIKNISIKN